MQEVCEALWKSFMCPCLFYDGKRALAAANIIAFRPSSLIVHGLRCYGDYVQGRDEYLYCVQTEDATDILAVGPCIGPDGYGCLTCDSATAVPTAVDPQAVERAGVRLFSRTPTSWFEAACKMSAGKCDIFARGLIALVQHLNEKGIAVDIGAAEATPMFTNSVPLTTVRQVSVFEDPGDLLLRHRAHWPAGRPGAADHHTLGGKHCTACFLVGHEIVDVDPTAVQTTLPGAGRAGPQSIWPCAVTSVDADSVTPGVSADELHIRAVASMASTGKIPRMVVVASLLTLAIVFGAMRVIEKNTGVSLCSGIKTL